MARVGGTGNTAIVCFPSDDPVFRAYVQTVVDDGAGVPQVQARVRSVYPQVVLRQRDSLASLGSEAVLYAYRDGGAGRRPSGPWWEDPDVARMAFATGGPYVEANDAACLLHGVAPGELVGRAWSEFSAEPAVGDARALWKAMIASGVFDKPGYISSTFLIRRADGSEGSVEYRTWRRADGLFTTAMRVTSDR